MKTNEALTSESGLMLVHIKEHPFSLITSSREIEKINAIKLGGQSFPKQRKAFTSEGNPWPNQDRVQLDFKTKEQAEQIYSFLRRNVTFVLKGWSD